MTILLIQHEIDINLSLRHLIYLACSELKVDLPLVKLAGSLHVLRTLVELSRLDLSQLHTIESADTQLRLIVRDVPLAVQEEPGGGRAIEILHTKGQNVLNFVSQGLNLLIDEVGRPRRLLLLLESWGRREGLRHGERRIVLLLSINKDLWRQIKGLINLL